MRRVLCRCVCGATTAVSAASVGSGHSKGCRNCTRKDHKTERHIWTGIKQRCTNPKHDMWPHYGGRGITVCERWLDFESFISDMGPRPSPKHTVERVDGNKGYSPENCHWADPYEQQNNRCNNRFIEYDGERLTLAQWSRKLNLNRATLEDRLEKMPVHEAFTRPINASKSKWLRNREATHA